MSSLPCFPAMSCWPRPWKVLVTLFLTLLCLGYLAAALNAKLAVGMTPERIADHYGNKLLSQAEQQQMQQQGYAEEELSFDDADDSASHDSSMSMGGDMHHDMPGMGMMAQDRSLPPQIMAQLSHIHWLAFALLLISIGSLIALTSLSEGLRSFFISVLGLSFLFDIGSLNLVRFVGDGFAWLTVAAGTSVGLCIALTTLRVLYELWWPTARNR